MLFKRKRLQNEALAVQHKNEYLLQGAVDQALPKEYWFYRPWGDGDPDFPTIAFQVMQEVLNSYYVVTYLHHVECGEDGGTTARKRECSPYQYGRFLQEHDMSANVLFSGKRELATMTEGMNLPLMHLLMDAETKEIWRNEVQIYAYRGKLKQCNTVEEWKEAVETQEYEIFLSYEEQHDLLTFNLNTETISQEQLTELVNKFCEQHGKKLELQV